MRPLLLHEFGFINLDDASLADLQTQGGSMTHMSFYENGKVRTVRVVDEGRPVGRAKRVLGSESSHDRSIWESIKRAKRATFQLSIGWPTCTYITVERRGEHWFYGDKVVTGSTQVHRVWVWE